MYDCFNNVFYDLLLSLDKILDSYAEEQRSEIKDFRINCTGHSMGVAFATIITLYLKKVKDAKISLCCNFWFSESFRFL
ncbi:MAG: lipase family protein [Wolbachia sp.]